MRPWALAPVPSSQKTLPQAAPRLCLPAPRSVLLILGLTCSCLQTRGKETAILHSGQAHTSFIP